MDDVAANREPRQKGDAPRQNCPSNSKGIMSNYEELPNAQWQSW